MNANPPRFCNCSRLAVLLPSGQYKKKSGSWVCERCDRMETLSEAREAKKKTVGFTVGPGKGGTIGLERDRDYEPICGMSLAALNL